MTYIPFRKTGRGLIYNKKKTYTTYSTDSTIGFCKNKYLFYNNAVCNVLRKRKVHRKVLETKVNIRKGKNEYKN